MYQPPSPAPGRNLGQLEARVRQLETENEELRYRIEQLSGANHFLLWPVRFPPSEEKILRLFYARQRVSQEAIWAVLYSWKPSSDWPSANGLAVRISNLRKRLRQWNIVIKPDYGVGWFMTDEDWARLRALPKELECASKSTTT